jgi:hypothetical protein
MRRLFVFPLLLLVIGSISAFPGQEPKAKEAPKADPKYAAAKEKSDKVVAAALAKAKVNPQIAVTKNGREFKLVDRERMRLPKTVKAFAATKVAPAKAALPFTPDPNYDWTKGDSLAFPMLGNDRVGDCFYTASAHFVQTWTGMNGQPTAFDTDILVGRYRQLSPADLGLTAQQMLGEFSQGIIGPNGPWRIFDILSVPVNDRDAILLAQWAFGGTFMTCSLRDTWRYGSTGMGANAGDTWDDDGTTPNPRSGHAMLINGINGDGTYKLQTWGLNPPVHLTQRGLETCDAELIACFSFDWFNAKGFAPNGVHYNDLAELWVTLGGSRPPAGKFPDPDKPLPPALEPKVTGSGKSVTVTIGTDVFIIDTDKKTVIFPSGWNGTPGVSGNVADELKAAGVRTETITAVIQLLDNLKNKKGDKTITEDLLRLLRDVPFPPKE